MSVLPLPPPPRVESDIVPAPKRHCSEMAPTMGSAILTRLADIEKTMEQRVESLNHKIAETTGQQAKDLEKSLQRIQCQVDNSTKTITGYQKLLADSLQASVCSAIQQLGQMRAQGA